MNKTPAYPRIKSALSERAIESRWELCGAKSTRERESCRGDTLSLGLTTLLCESLQHYATKDTLLCHAPFVVERC